MENFLDTNIIFHYSNYTKSSSNIIEKCYLFITNKKGSFILCYAVLSELKSIIRDRSRLFKAVIEKIKNPDYSLENSKLVPPRKTGEARKLYRKFKDQPVEKVRHILDNQRKKSEIRIEKFLQTQVDEKVIPIEQINNDLVKKIHEIISNHADCKIMASALQLQKERPVFLFVTADNDFDPNGYKYLKEHFEINYPKEKCKFPELLNLIYSK
ncbi:MAG TPA: hypothetical protein VJ912_03010 [Candidatus Nanoarchaeia archaeon]|nr:hypothetical protein [Candidatus Nanoarchaeia archaeon]